MTTATPEAPILLATFLPIELVDDNPFQPRTTFLAKKMDDVLLALMASITANAKGGPLHLGLVQAITVRQHGDRYQIVGGHRRTQALRNIGALFVPAMIKEDVTDDEMRDMAAAENMARKDHTPLENASVIKNAFDRSGNLQEAANMVGIPLATAKIYLALAQLPAYLQRCVEMEQIPIAVCPYLMDLPDDLQEECADAIVDRKLNSTAAIACAKAFITKSQQSGMFAEVKVNPKASREAHQKYEMAVLGIKSYMSMLGTKNDKLTEAAIPAIPSLSQEIDIWDAIIKEAKRQQRLLQEALQKRVVNQ